MRSKPIILFIGRLTAYMMKPVVELEQVSKIYGSGKAKVEALKDVDFKIKSGEFVSIIGPSGSGKSTMLNMIGVLDRPTHGEIWIDGKEVEKLSDDKLAIIRGKKIGFVFQFFNLIPTLTALENVTLPMWFQGTEREKMDARGKKLLKLVGLGDRMDHKPNELSGGQMQRVAIARSLANNPEMILADEPTGNLDTKTGAEILKLMKELHKKEKKTLVMVTHDPRIARMSERMVLLVDGKIHGDTDKKTEMKTLLKIVEGEKGYSRK